MAELDRLIVRIEADVADLKREMAGLQRTLNREAGRSARAFDKMNRSLNSIRRSFRLLKTAIIGVGFAKVAQGAIGAADSLTLLRARIGLLTNSQKELDVTMERIFAVAQETRSSFEDIAALYARFARATQQFDPSADQLLAFTEGLSKLVTISGAGPQEAAAALFQLSQALQRGQLRGEEFNSVAEQMGSLLDLLVDEFNRIGMQISRRDLIKLAQDGKITGDILLNSVINGLEGIRGAFSRIPRTAGQALQQLKNDLFKVTGEALLSAEASKEIGEALDEIRDIVKSPEFKEGIVILTKLIIAVAKLGAQGTAALGSFAAATKTTGNALESISTETLERSIASLKRQIEGLREPQNVLQEAFNLVTPQRVIDNAIAHHQRELDRLTAELERRGDTVTVDVETSPNLLAPIGTPPVQPLPGPTDEQKKALDQLAEMIQSLEQEAQLLAVTGAERDRLAATMQAENILRGANLELTDEQRQAVLAATDAVIAQTQANEAAERAQERMNALHAEAAQIIHQLSGAQGEHNANVVRYLELLNQGLLTQEQFNAAVAASADVARESDEAFQKLVSVSERLGDTIAGAFEDAIVEGESLRDVINGLAQDIQRILARAIVTDPLSDFLKEQIQGSGVLQRIGIGTDAREPTGADQAARIGEAAAQDIAARPDIFGITQQVDSGGILERLFGKPAPFDADFYAEVEAGMDRLKTSAEQAGNVLGEQMTTQAAEAAVQTGVMAGAQTAGSTSVQAASVTLATALTQLTAAATTAAAALQAIGGGAGLSGLFSGVSASGLGISSGAFSRISAAAVSDVASLPFFHEGGVVGGLMPRPLQPDEILGVLHRGETVRTQQQEAALRRAGTGAREISINVNLSPPPGFTASQARETGNQIGRQAAMHLSLMQQRGVI